MALLPLLLLLLLLMMMMMTMMIMLIFAPQIQQGSVVSVLEETWDFE